MTRILHYSAEPFVGPLRDRTGELLLGMKPRGLWLSVEGAHDWKWWCEAEEFHLEALRYVTQIVLCQNANVLRVNTVQAIDQITRDHATIPVPGMTSRLYVDWPAIGREYDGIIIAPYQWSRRLSDDSMWYYGWDCASGCIWNPRAIAAMVPQ